MDEVVGVNHVGGEGVPLSHILRYHADRDPDRPILTMFDQDISRAELDRRTNRLARASACRTRT